MASSSAKFLEITSTILFLIKLSSARATINSFFRYVAIRDEAIRSSCSGLSFIGAVENPVDKFLRNCLRTGKRCELLFVFYPSRTRKSNHGSEARGTVGRPPAGTKNLVLTRLFCDDGNFRRSTANQTAQGYPQGETDQGIDQSVTALNKALNCA